MHLLLLLPRASLQRHLRISIETNVRLETKEFETYWVYKNHAFVLEAQVLGQEGHLALELLEKSINLALLNLDYERLGTIDTLSRYHQITAHYSKENKPHRKRKWQKLRMILTL